MAHVFSLSLLDATVRLISQVLFGSADDCNIDFLHEERIVAINEYLATG